ncbi:MAG TPA: VWA domain-containing protein [Rhodanobacteraceae bacterium]|nr:VWA domain-containing protein [Rhodanobacteraceae bacterium]
MYEFAWPWLFLLLPLPWVLRRWLPPLAADVALHLPQRGLRLADAEIKTRGAWPWLLLLAWLLLLTAAARPQTTGAAEPVKRSGRAMMLAIDLSGSMGTQDMQLGGYKVSRFAAIRAIASDFISRRDGDELGLILFGSSAYVMTPLTYDLTSVRKQMESVAIGLAGQETAIGDAIAVATKRLKALPAAARVLVLLTDGVNTAGAIAPLEAAAIAKQAGLRIYTIGVGSEHMRVNDFFGSHLVNPSAELDVGMLTHIAEETGGKFFRATDTGELAAAYHAIDQLEPVAGKQRLLRPPTEWFRYPLLAAVLALVLDALWRRGSRWRERRA